MDDFTRPKRSKLQVDETGGNTTSSNKNLNAVKGSEPPFATPEEVAAKDSKTGSSPQLTRADDPNPLSKGRFGLRWPQSWKGWTILVAGVLILLTTAWWIFLKSDKPLTTPPQVTQKAEEEPKITTVPSKLTGLPVEPEVNERQVTAVMIENSMEARPQSGLYEAGVVFEAIAEGGITRFCALYQDTQPKNIGPIRSVRPYYIHWFMPFDAAIAHVGGSPKALLELKSAKAKDLDQFANAAAYRRTTNKYAPHNVYSSISNLDKLEKSKGFKTSSFTGFVRKEEKRADKATAKNIALRISSVNYNLRYKYNRKTNSYGRFMGGRVHKDERTGKQLMPKVVVAVIMKRALDSDGHHTKYTTTGSGRVLVFQDGKVTKGTWKKTSREAQWQFRDAKGNTLALNPGQTWLTMVDSVSAVTY